MPSPANEQTYQAGSSGPQGAQGDSGIPRVVHTQTRFQMPVANARNAATGELPTVSPNSGVLPSAGYRGVGSAANRAEPFEREPFVTYERFRDDN